MRAGSIIASLWILFWLSWLIAAFWSSRPAKAVGLRAEAGSRIVLILGGIIFFVPANHYAGPLRFWQPSAALFWTCIALMIAGLAFSWWARLIMGPLWSASITRKLDHRVLDVGPFAIVRHPIYTGILTAVIGTLLVKGTAWGIIGALLIAVGLWMKARIEERWLTAELGARDYAAYRERVPMLIPFGPR